MGELVHASSFVYDIDTPEDEVLSNRAIISLKGKDVRSFLQGLITNDIKILEEKTAFYSLMLMPQGKFLYDFFVIDNGDEILLDCSAAKYDEICRKLAMYKLRSDVVIGAVKDEWVVAAWSSSDLIRGPSVPVGITYRDPRAGPVDEIMLGCRAAVRKEDLPEFAKTHQLISSDKYRKLLYEFTIPEADTDLIADKSFPLEFGLDYLNAISFDKGCYVGQELTARTKHRGVVRKKLYKVVAEQSLDQIEHGSEITINNIKIGQFCSGLGKVGKALIREEDYQKALQTNTRIMLSGLRVTLSLAYWL